MLWEGVVDDDVRALYEPWMIQADRLLEDEELIEGVFAAQGKRHKNSAKRGRAQTPAETVLRLLLLKHMRNRSFDILEREVRANLVYRDFARIGMGKAPDAKTLARIAPALVGDVIAELHRRLIEIARQRRSGARAADARGYDRGGDQHSLPHGTRVCWAMVRAR